MTRKEFSMMTCSSVDSDRTVVYIEFKHAVRIDLNTAREIVANRLDFCNYEKHFIVADVSKVREVTSDARKFLQLPDGGMKNILGAALVASNPVAALIANIFIKTPKDFPAKFFSNKKDAYHWVAAKIGRPVSETL